MKAIADNGANITHDNKRKKNWPNLELQRSPKLTTTIPFTCLQQERSWLGFQPKFTAKSSWRNSRNSMATNPLKFLATKPRILLKMTTSASLTRYGIRVRINHAAFTAPNVKELLAISTVVNPYNKSSTTTTNQKDIQKRLWLLRKVLRWSLLLIVEQTPLMRMRKKNRMSLALQRS